MKKVLMISYFFPPMGGVAVQRITKFCKFLPEFGWQPIVLTVKNGYWTVWDHSNRDYKTGYEIIYRTPFYSPFTILTKLSFGKANFGTTSEDKGKAIEQPSWRKRAMRNISMLWCVPDEFISWFFGAIYKGLWIINNHKPELIYANDGPHTCSIIALVLSKISGIPFISDFRDLWTGDPNFNPRNRLEKKIQYQFEKQVLIEAQKIITVSNGCAEALSRPYGKTIFSKMEIINNGFDLDDFRNGKLPDTFKKKNKFRIVYTGSFFGKFMSSKNFLAALSRFIQNSQLSESEIEVIFAGTRNGELGAIANKLQLDKYLYIYENLDHNIACSLQKSADLLLLIVYSQSGGKNVLSAKLFEYFAAGAPILAIVPDGEVKKTIKKTGTGMVANPDDEAEIEGCLTSLYEKIYIKREHFQRKEAEINKFNRRGQTKSLAEIFDEVAATKK